MAKDRDPALAKAIEAVGGVRKLAQALGLSDQNVSQWKRPPPQWVRRVADLSGVPKHELAPDLYDAPDKAA